MAVIWPWLVNWTIGCRSGIYIMKSQLLHVLSVTTKRGTILPMKAVRDNVWCGRWMNFVFWDSKSDQAHGKDLRCTANKILHQTWSRRSLQILILDMLHGWILDPRKDAGLVTTNHQSEQHLPHLRHISITLPPAHTPSIIRFGSVLWMTYIKAISIFKATRVWSFLFFFFFFFCFSFACQINMPRKSSQSTAATSAEQPLRRKVTLACMVCRKKKVKCNGVQPACARCQAMGLQCQYSDPPKKRGPPKGYVEVINSRARRIESLLSNSGGIVSHTAHNLVNAHAISL